MPGLLRPCGKGSGSIGGGEAGSVVADLGEDPGAKNGAQSGHSGQETGSVVGLERDRHGVLEVGDRNLRLDDRDQTTPGMVQGIFNRWWLMQGGLPQFGNDGVGQAGDGRSPAALQQRDDPLAGELEGHARSGGGA